MRDEITTSFWGGTASFSDVAVVSISPGVSGGTCSSGKAANRGDTAGVVGSGDDIGVDASALSS